MPLFRYEVADRNGKMLAGVIDAGSETDARQRLASRGFTVNVVMPAALPPPQAQPRPQTQPGPATWKPAVRTSRTSAPPGELAVFFRSLQAYLQAGMTVFQALSEIANRSPNRGMRIISQRMASRVQAGEQLNVAMLEYPRAFPPHVVGVVAAGELGGFLPIMAGDIALDYELSQRASSRWLKFALRLGWINAAGTLLVAPLVPSMFTPGVEDLRGGVMAYLHFVGPNIALPMALVFLGYHILAAILRQPSLRTLRDSLLLRAPAYGLNSRMRSLASFARILWRLQSAGILPIQAWDAASRASENVVVASSLLAQVPAVRGGAKFSDALAATGYFTVNDTRVLAAAELSGQVVEALQRMSAHYEDAALTSAGRAKWWAIHPVLIANILVLGYAVYCVEIKSMMNQFDWVDKFMGTE